MDRVETTAGGLILAVGVALLIGALGFPFLLQGVPGPGFLPLLISFGIIASGVVVVTRAVRHRAGAQVRWPPLSGWMRVALMMATMAASFWLLEALGFVVVTAVFMLVMIYCLGERSWRVLATVPVLSALGLYLVFAVWLRVPLPKGIITFIG
ncbi:MAG: tripartite tricarboxylate transporter TctB family protein [Rhodospirillaceae bacterium]